MPEAYQRQGVLDHHHLDARITDSRGDAGIALCERRFRAKINLRGKPAKPFLDAVTEVLGVSPPKMPNTTANVKNITALWLGPDEWLVVGAPEGEDALAASLRAALDGQHYSVTDVTEGRTIIGLSGPHARDVLMKGCPIDIHPREFKAGDCAQSTLAKANIILHQVSDDPSYDIYVERSFASYLWDWLEDASLEYGLAVVRG